MPVLSKSTKLDIVTKGQSILLFYETRLTRLLCYSLLSWNVLILGICAGLNKLLTVKWIATSKELEKTLYRYYRRRSPTIIELDRLHYSCTKIIYTCQINGSSSVFCARRCFYSTAISKLSLCIDRKALTVI